MRFVITIISTNEYEWMKWMSCGLFSGYLVLHTTDATLSDRDWAVAGVQGAQMTTTIRDLSPQTTYYFKVQARNTMGYGPMSPTIIFRTPNGQF